MASTITEKVAKILNQAENAGTEAEAAVFLAKAQELATTYSVDLAKARHLTIAKERTVPVTRTITLGVRGTRGLNTLVNLFTGIARANDVKINIAHNSTYIVAFGFAEDIDVSEALYTSLVVQMSNAVAEYKTTGEWKQETKRRPGRDRKVWKHDHEGGYRAGYCVFYCGYEFEYVPGEIIPVPWLSARLDFQQAFGDRIETRLAAAKRQAEAAARAADQDSDSDGPGTELVLVEKRKAVEEHYHATSTARGFYGGQRRANYGRAYQAGSEAGSRARLGGSSSLPGARKALS